MATRSPSRLERTAGFAALVLGAWSALLCCSGGLSERKPLEQVPIGTVKNVPRTAKEDSDGGTTTPNSGTPSRASQGASACTSSEFENLENILDECRTAMPKTSELPSSFKDKLEVKITTSTASTAPGGRVDLTLVLRNKSSSDLPLYFTGDPNPRFEVEAANASGKRVDVPTGKHPPWPKGASPKAGGEVKAARVTLEKGGTAKVKLTWDAVKVKWAPDKISTWDGRGYPRAPAGPLPSGKYRLRVNVPLIGVFEKGELDLPIVAVDVGN